MIFFLYFVTLVGMCVLLFRVAAQRGALYFPVCFLAYITLFHVLIPLILYVAPDHIIRHMPRASLLTLLTDAQYALSWVLVITACCLFRVGWELGGRVRLPVFRTRGLNWRRDTPETLSAVVLSWIVLVVGAVGFVGFFAAYGGIFRALEIARLVRTGMIEVANPLSFLRPIGDFVKVAALMFIALWLAGRRGAIVMAGLLASLALCFMMLFFQGGRLSLAAYISMIIIMFVSRGHLSIGRAGIVASIAATLLFFGYPILFFVYGFFSYQEFSAPVWNDEATLIVFVVAELSFPTVGLATALDAVHTGAAQLRYGLDVMLGILSIIPARLVDPGVPHVGNVHTAISNPHGGGTIPVDMMIYGIYAFGLVGPAIFAFFVGFVTHMILRYVERIPWPQIRYAFEIFFIFSLARHLVYFNPASSINSVYFLLICFVLVYLVSNRVLWSRLDARRPDSTAGSAQGTR